MVRMVYCAMRKEAVSLREFRGYFDGEHKELVCDLARALQAVDFRQSLTLMIEENFAVMVERGTGMPYDGVIELWWDNSAQPISNRQCRPKKRSLKLKIYSGRLISSSILQNHAFFSPNNRNHANIERVNHDQTYVVGTAINDAPAFYTGASHRRETDDGRPAQIAS